MSDYSDADRDKYSHEPENLAWRSGRKKTQTENGLASLADYNSASDSENSCDETIDFWGGFLEPTVESILGFSDSKYLVKLKDRSYIHLKWLAEEDLLKEGRQGKLKLNRFVRDKLPFIEAPFLTPYSWRSTESSQPPKYSQSSIRDRPA